MIETEPHFIQYLQSTISPSTSKDLVARWRSHELQAIERGREIVHSISHLSKIDQASVLDIGSGYGGACIAFGEAGAKVIGVDPFPHRVKGASIRASLDYGQKRTHFILAPGEELPFASESFDIIVCEDVMEHVVSHSQVLREIARTLKPGGVLYLQFPNLFSWENIRRDPHYDLFGASLLPPRFGAWYVTRFRKKSETYQVGYFPVASRIIHILQKCGVSVIHWEPMPKRKVGALTPLLRLFRLNTLPIVKLVCQKSIT